MTDTAIYGDPLGGDGGTAVAPLDFCEPCHAGDHERCSEGGCECDGLCGVRRAREATNEQA